MDRLWTVVIVLVILWLLGLLMGLGTIIHVLLIIVIGVVLFRLLLWQRKSNPNLAGLKAGFYERVKLSHVKGTQPENLKENNHNADTYTDTWFGRS